MEKFIYVFSKEDRDALLRAGFSQLKNDENNNLFVFANQTNMNFDLLDMEFVRSNTLSF